MLDKIIIFCDGASKGNPGPGAYGAVVVAHENTVGTVTELGEADKHTTNNRMELSGAIAALIVIKKSDLSVPVTIHTDSKYVINGMTGWIFGWQKNGWQTKDKKDVSNRDLWEKLYLLSHGRKISWKYVGGHMGIAGNERCDEIASELALGHKVSLYSGKFSDYKINILDLGHDEVKKKVKSTKGVKAYSYLSLIKGVVYRDVTWADCEKRVGGVKGVKYKKAVSADQEQEILKSWGIKQ